MWYTKVMNKNSFEVKKRLDLPPLVRPWCSWSLSWRRRRPWRLHSEGRRLHSRRPCPRHPARWPYLASWADHIGTDHTVLQHINHLSFWWYPTSNIVQSPDYCSKIWFIVLLTKAYDLLTYLWPCFDLTWFLSTVCLRTLARVISVIQWICNEHQKVLALQGSLTLYLFLTYFF